MADNMTVNFHAGDETDIDVSIRQREDGSDYFVIALGSRRDLTIFGSPHFVDRLGGAIANKVLKLEREPTEAEAMFIRMVEKELDEEGSCP